MKKLLCIAAIAALVLTGCAKDLQVKTVDKLSVEYGDKLDNDKLYAVSYTHLTLPTKLEV